MAKLLGQAKIHYSLGMHASHKELEWVHLNWGAHIPPSRDGSFNHLIWDILQRRKDRDLLVCEYFPEAYAKSRSSNCAIAYIEHHSDSRYIYLIRRILNVLRGRHTVTPFLYAATHEIRESGCHNVLIWDGIVDLPIIRRLLPNHNLVYAQRHYDYPSSVMNYNSCDILITQTRGQTRLAFERMPRLEPYVVTIPNGVELEVFRPPSDGERQQLRNQFGLPDNQLIVIFPSKLSLHKGTRYLLRWIEACNDVHFLVTGKLLRLPARHEAELKNILTYNPNVTWIGGCSRADMPDYYRASDICLMPGLWREGFSMSAIEAMATGLPIIASEAGFYTEIIHKEYNGLLCRQEYLYTDALSHIGRLKGNPDFRKRLGRNARCYAERRLSREKMLMNFDAFFDGNYDAINDDLSIPNECKD